MFSEKAIDNFFAGISLRNFKKTFGSDAYLQTLNTTLSSVNSNNLSYDLSIAYVNGLMTHFHSIFNAIHLELIELKNQKHKIFRAIKLVDKEEFNQGDLGEKFDYLNNIIIDKCFSKYLSCTSIESLVGQTAVDSTRPLAIDIKLLKNLFKKVAKDNAKLLRAIKKVRIEEDSTPPIPDLLPQTARLLKIDLSESHSKNLKVLTEISNKTANLETYFGIGIFFLQHSLKEGESLSDPHILSLINNAPPLANAYINSSQYSEHVSYLKINSLQLSNSCVQYPVHFFNQNLMNKNEEVIEEYRGISEGYRYDFCKLRKNGEIDESDNSLYSFNFIGEDLQTLYPNFLPALFRTKAFRPTKSHPKLTYNQQRLIDLLPSEMYFSRPQDASDELEIDLDNALYDHPLFNKFEGNRTYELFVESSPEGLKWYMHNPSSSPEIQEAQKFLDEIRTAYSSMFVDKSEFKESLFTEEVGCFTTEIINARKDIKIEELNQVIMNGIEYKCFLLSFYDIGLNFTVFSKDLNHSRQGAAILAYIYMLIKQLRPKCFKNI